jgi:lipoprotein-anchoring transpeptidase ErfK/SrfK
MRPNGRTGWVRQSALRPTHTVHTSLIVNRHTLRATLFDHGKKRFSARIGVGKASTPTPAGHFWIREKFRVKGNTIYGPRAMGTSAYAPTLSEWPGGGVVGLHGTNEPNLIPGRPSHGCVRLRNADILRLYRLVPTGTPVRIL